MFRPFSPTIQAVLYLAVSSPGYYLLSENTSLPSQLATTLIIALLLATLLIRLNDKSLKLQPISWDNCKLFVLTETSTWPRVLYYTSCSAEVSVRTYVHREYNI